MKHIVGLGEILWDLLPEGKKMGGAPANFAYHIHELGLKAFKAYIISSIGNDSNGNEIQTQLDDLGINQDYLSIDNNHKTGIVAVTINKIGSPDYCITNNVAWDFIPPISNCLINKVDAVCFGTLAQRSAVSAQTMINFLDALPPTTLRVFDINLRQQFYSTEIIHQSLKHTNIFKLNEEELQCIAKLFGLVGDEISLLAKLTQRYQLQLCILTKGEHGSILYSCGKISVHKGLKVKVKDSVGAGDAFTAAIVLGFFKEFDLDYMNDCANQLAAYVCQSSGAMPKLPTEIVNLFR